MSSNEPDILVICFEPFAGRSRNGGAEVAQALAERSSRIRVVKLPVLWSAVVPEAIANTVNSGTWRAVLVLGEGHSYAVIVEQVAKAGAAFLDEAGQRPNELTPGTPRQVFGDFVWRADPERAEHWKWDLKLYPKSYGIVEGMEAGLWTCNRAFLGACLARDQVRKTGSLAYLTGLVHIPPQDEWEAYNPDHRYVQIMTGAVHAILACNGV